MAEWFKALVLKTNVAEMLPEVRILLPPPRTKRTICKQMLRSYVARDVVLITKRTSRQRIYAQTNC